MGTDAFFARSTPMLSTRSSVLRRPAVSATITGRPPISSDSSSMSRVVPGTGVTIAASRWAFYPTSRLGRRAWGRNLPRKLSKLLLPAFGGPNMARRIPDRMISPRRLSWRCVCIVPRSFWARDLANNSHQFMFLVLNGKMYTLFVNAIFQGLALAEIDEGLDVCETSYYRRSYLVELGSSSTLYQVVR